MYIFGNCVSECVTGMSNLVSRKALDDCCLGLHRLADFLAEDFFMAKMLRENGYAIRMAAKPAIQFNVQIIFYFARKYYR